MQVAVTMARSTAMTDQAAPRTAGRRRRRRVSPFPVVAGTLATFTALFGFLTYQLRIGHDPALGAKTVIQPVVAPKRIVVKRIDDELVVTKVVPASTSGGAATSGSAPVTTSASSGAAAPAPVQSAPVVIQSAPAPVAAAPAPAPVVTKTS